MHTTPRSSNISSSSADALLPRVRVALRWRQARTPAAVDRSASAAAQSQSHAPTSSPQSRLRVLRRHRARPNSTRSDTDDAFTVAGIGLAPPARHGEALPPDMQVVALTPLIAVEGFPNPTGPPSVAQKETALTGNAGPSPPTLRWSDAHLTGELAELIVTELLDVSSASATSCKGEKSRPLRHREVVTFALGVQGCGKTSFLLGGVHGGSSPLTPTAEHRLPELTSAPTSVTDGLFFAVLDRLFETAPSHHPAGVSAVAMCVVEIRDAAPLRHPSVLQRPRDTVDLLSGQLLHRQERESESDSECASSSSSVADEPTDIPAACYVQVRSTAEAAQVLHTALLSSVAWQPPAATDADHFTALSTAPLLLRPAGLPKEEKLSHLCVTVLVSCPADPHEEASAPSAGIWKLWDLAGPSPSCGYHPLSAAGDEHAATVGRTAAGNAVSTLPWCNRYSLPALTHTCLIDFGSRLATPSTPDTTLVGRDTAALQIVASAMRSCSLVMPVCVVVDDAAADDVNAEVLRCADGWTACARHREDSLASKSKGRAAVERRRRCAKENAVAAQRVLRDFTVPFAAFMRENGVYSFSDASSPTTAAAREDSPTRGGIRPKPERGESSVPGPAQSWTVEQRQTELAADTVASLLDASLATAVQNSFKGSKQWGGTAAKLQAVAAPLSINVTTVDDDSAATALRGAARAKARHNVSDNTHSAVLADVSVEPGNKDTPTSTSAGDNATVTAPAASIGPAITATLQRAKEDNENAMAIRVPLETSVTTPQCPAGVSAKVSSAIKEEASRTAHEVQSLSGEESRSKPLAHAAHQRQSSHSREGLHTPEERESSPPSVTCTGPRGPTTAASGIPSAGLYSAHCRSPSRNTPSTNEAPTDRSDRAEGSMRCDPTALRFSNISEPRGELVARVDAAAGPDAVAREHDARQSDAAVLRLCGPYCNQFIALYEEMRRDVAAWRAAEGESLQAIAALAEQHTKDIDLLTQLLRRGSEATQQADASAVGTQTTSPSDSDGTTAAIAATSALIYEQLLRSEEKVAWLERQLVQWRQRTHEASSLQLSALEETADDNDGGNSSALVDASREGGADGDQDPPLSALWESGSAAAGRGGDPTRRHVLQAQCILRRLLARCGRAYASAQQRSTRWQEQVSFERLSKDALLGRVAELEEELAAYRQRLPGAAQSPAPPPLSSQPLRVSAGSPETPLWRRVAAGVSLATPDLRESRELSSLSAVTSLSRCGRRAGANATTIEMSSREGEDAVRRECSAAAGATPAQVSPIRSLADTALSVPSPPDRPLRQPALPHRTPSVTSASSSSSHAVAPAHLAALLGRAVVLDVGCGAAAGSRAASPSLPAANLFDVHVGPPSVSTVGVPSEVPGSVTDQREVRASSHGMPRPLLNSESPPHYKLMARPSHPTASFSADPTETRRAEPFVKHTGEEDRDLVQRATASSHEKKASSLLAISKYPLRVVQDADTYPTAALQRLQEAAAQLATSAVRLSGVHGDRHDSAESRSIESAAELLRRTLDERQTPTPRSLSAGEGREKRGDAEAGWSRSASLYASVSELRSASQAVQREAHDAALRERAYLSTILFSPPSTPPRVSHGQAPCSSTESALQ